MERLKEILNIYIERGGNGDDDCFRAFFFQKIVDFCENCNGMTEYVMGVDYNSTKCRSDPRFVQISRQQEHLGSG